MFVEFLRHNKYASAILTFLRLYVGYEWLTAGYGKLTAGFEAGGFLKGAAAKAVGDHPAVQAWWADFLNSFAIPNVHLFEALIPWGETLVGLGLLLGCLTKSAAFFGMMMNFAFMLSGTTSTNPQLVLLSIFIIIAGHNAGRIGVDGLLHKYGKGLKFPHLPKRHAPQH
ncbi:DoxX family membrane protein [Ectobacillus ponti]|uniref:DoxX family membrane protein n=1 Tax=Ectobacillus ponti TaxID=2961894 RepID=A0AA42BSK8_9BACI|nr:DoxX family membrane protein [Ectobacillus ponti]MCP8970644.1 DoxX family membrane protein [Ectobacillus ponti]